MKEWLYSAYQQRARIGRQEFTLAHQPLGGRSATGSVLTARRIEFVGARTAADWDDTRTGPPGRLKHGRGTA